MTKNILTILLRTIQKRFFVFGLNILGLSIGVSCVLFITIYSIDELSFDKHIKNHERIYRVVTEYQTNSSSDLSMAESFLGVAPILKREFAEVEEAVRILPYKGDITIQYKSGNKTVFKAENAYRVDKEFFGVFKHTFVYGNESSLSKPNCIVVTQSLAKKLFGDAPPINKAVLIDNEIYGVTGVINDLPRNSDLYYDALISHDFSDYDNDWGNPAGFTYLLLNNSTDLNKLEASINAVATEKAFSFFVKEYDMESTIKISLQSLSNIHFSKQLSGDSIKSNPIYLKVLITLGVLILMIILFNHSNFSISLYATRIHELSVRKILGINKLQLMGQMIVESAIIGTLALIISMIFFTSLLPTINLLTRKNLLLSTLLDSKVLGIVLTLFLLIVIAGSFYTIFYSLKNRAIRGLTGTSTFGNNRLRKVLIGGQLAFTAALVFFTITVHNQIGFLKNRDLGFSAGSIAMVTLSEEMSSDLQVAAFKEDVLKNSSINDFALINELSYPGSERLRYQLGWLYNDNKRIETNFNLYEVDSLFPDLLKMRFVAGSNFALSSVSSPQQAVVNQSFVKMAGFKEAKDIIGELIHAFDDKIEIVGVVSDFNYQDFQQSINPLVMVPITSTTLGVKKMLFKINAPGDLSSLESSYQNLAKQSPFEYSFLDDRVSKMLEQEQTTGQVTQIFSLLAILLAGIGLYSLSNLIIVQRTKEIGVRKILGISQSSLTMLLSKEFFVLSFISFTLSIPLAWVQSQRWLTGYAFRTEIEITTIAVTALIIITILILSIITNVIRSAKINPVDLLKNE